MTVPGRRAALPAAGYRPALGRDQVGDRGIRITFYPESGGKRTEFDLSDLPVSNAMREWFADALAAGTGPSGSARTLTSARSLLGAIRSFARYLDSLYSPPTAPDQLRGTHWDGYLLAQRESNRRSLMINLRIVIRHAPGVSSDFSARMQRTQIIGNPGRSRPTPKRSSRASPPRHGSVCADACAGSTQAARF